MSQPNPHIPAATGSSPSIVYVPISQQPNVTVHDKYLSKQSIGTGIVQVIIGGLCIAFNIAALVIDVSSSLGFVGHGFWCGVIFIVTGGFGIGAGKNKNKCQIITYLVLCVVSTSFTITLLAMGICGTLFTEYIYTPTNYRSSTSQGIYQGARAMGIALAASAFVEAVFAIYGAAVCCNSGICSSDNPNPMTAIQPVNPGGYFPNNEQVIYDNQTQGGQQVYLPQPVTYYPSGSVARPPPSVPTYTQPGW